MHVHVLFLVHLPLLFWFLFGCFDFVITNPRRSVFRTKRRDCHHTLTHVHGFGSFQTIFVSCPFQQDHLEIAIAYSSSFLSIIFETLINFKVIVGIDRPKEDGIRGCTKDLATTTPTRRHHFAVGSLLLPCSHRTRPVHRNHGMARNAVWGS